MDAEEFQAYLAEVNRQAEPFVPLFTCARCKKPIKDECVILTRFDPPLWLHVDCDDFPNGEPGFEAVRVG